MTTYGLWYILCINLSELWWVKLEKNESNSIPYTQLGTIQPSFRTMAFGSGIWPTSKNIIRLVSLFRWVGFCINLAYGWAISVEEGALPGAQWCKKSQSRSFTQAYNHLHDRVHPVVLHASICLRRILVGPNCHHTTVQ